jgi:hypothetical protein
MQAAYCSTALVECASKIAGGVIIQAAPPGERRRAGIVIRGFSNEYGTGRKT